MCCSKLSRTPRIRLFFFLPTFTFGGAERTSLNLLNGIDKKGFSITLVTSGKIYSHFRHLEVEKFIPIEDLGMHVWFQDVKHFLQDIRKVAMLLKKENPELAFGMMHYPSSLLVAAKRLYRIKLKIIVSPRGPSVEYLRYFEPRLKRKLFLRFLFGFFCRHADGIIVASEGMKQECIGHYHAHPDRVSVIPNSVDFDDIRNKSAEETDLHISEGFQVIATSGRLEREKNFPFLLRAFSAARAEKRLKLVIIGDGSERKMLHTLAQELGVSEDVIFTGYQKNPFRFIQRSDLFVHTCLFEGFANAIIEAMACKVPVIAVNCPYGPRDIIRHGENGFLVDMDDEGSLVQTLLMLTGDKELTDKVAGKGFARAMEFSIGRMVQGYEQFFTEVVQN
jgi:glycosyltransferase involved in cell wall biosynthesis